MRTAVGTVTVVELFGVDEAVVVEEVLDAAETFEHGDEGGGALDEEEEGVEGDAEEGE